MGDYLYTGCFCRYFQSFLTCSGWNCLYTPHKKYQVMSHSYSCFFICVAPVAHRNHLFYLYQQNKRKKKKGSSDMLVIEFFEVVKFPYANKTIHFILIIFGKFHLRSPCLRMFARFCD